LIELVHRFAGIARFKRAAMKAVNITGVKQLLSKLYPTKIGLASMRRASS
jgi:hypothetical protein